MSCQRVLAMLSAFMDGEVSPADGKMIDDHLAGCSSCAQELDALSSTARILGSVPEIEPPALLLEQIETATIKRPTFTAGLRAIFGKASRIPQYARWATAGGIAAGLLVLLLISQPDAQRTAHAPSSAPVTPSDAFSTPAPIAPSDSAGSEVAVTPAPMESPSPARTIHRTRPARSVTRRHVAARTPEREEEKPAPKKTVVVAKESTDAPEADVAESIVADDAANPSETGEVVAAIPEAEDKKLHIISSEKVKPDTLVGQKNDVLSGLRAEIRERNKQRLHESQVERIEGRKYSVELASIRF